MQQLSAPPGIYTTPRYYHRKLSLCSPRGNAWASLRCTAAAGDDVDIAVFRFTLGIPGFDDALIPRVVGAVGAGLLVLNHVLAVDPPSAAQGRAELLGAVLAAVAVVTPTIEQRLLEAFPGRGRLAAPKDVEGGSNIFALSESMAEAVQRELAWASFALLRNTNICGLAAVWGGQVVLCRGIVGAAVAAGGTGTSLEAATQAWQQVQLTGGIYCSDRADIARQGLHGCALIPSGAQSVLVQPMQAAGGSQLNGADSQGALVLISERERALSSKERAWAQALANKLGTALPQL